jgi:SAM-dependent methyltransferase
MTSGPDFYDDEAVFARYIQRRQRPDNPNDTIEKPVFMTLLGDVHETDILDLGCGDGRFGVEVFSMGCRSYTGVEASQRMVNLAEANLAPVGGVLHHASIESWTYPQVAFDRIISRLALHYIDDITTIFRNIHKALKPGGHLVFSVEHPVITSDNSAATATGIRYNWTVDNYFVTGRRDVDWMGSQVVKYHRTIEDYFAALQQAGFTVEQLREPGPQRTFISDEPLYQRRLRIPLFLMFRAQRNDMQ